MSNIDYIVVVLIISAAALAFVVLYNLTNINITERQRELATIKVLGFYDREVSAYIYRENGDTDVSSAHCAGLVLGVCPACLRGQDGGGGHGDVRPGQSSG